MNRRRMGIFVLVVIILLSSFPNFTASATGDTYANENVLSLENDYLRVMFEDDGTFTVNDKSSGATFASSQDVQEDYFSTHASKQTVSSELVVHYYLTREELISNNTDIAYSSSATKTVLREEHGVRVQYDFEDCKIKVDVIYSLDGAYLSASIDFSTVKAYGEYNACRMELLPGFFAGDERDEGYMLVPDGSGALIQFNNGAENAYQADVYGTEATVERDMVRTQTEDVHMPVFGIVKNDVAMLGIVEEGDAISSITAFSGNATQKYNTAYSSVGLYYTSSKEMFGNSYGNSSSVAYYKTKQTEGMERYTVLYRFLDGEDADYSGMAKAYREYLIENEKLTKRVSDPVLNVDLIGAIDVKKNFLGLTYYRPLALTTYEQSTKIAEYLKESGIEKLSLRYIGWNNDGVSNETVLKKLKTMRVLGGRKDFDTFNEKMKKLGIDVTYDVDFVKFYSGAKDYKVASPTNEVLEFTKYLRSVYVSDLNTRVWYHLSPAKWKKIADEIFLSADKLEISNLSINALTSTLYSDFRSKDTYTRGETQQIVCEVLEKENTRSISGSAVNAYAFETVNKVYEAPSYTSGYFILDKEVPFYQMVLHGYIDMTAETQFTAENRDIQYLKAVETGSQLLYTGIYSDTSKVRDTQYDDLYGTQYELWSSDAVVKYEEYYPLLKKIYDQEIISHEEVIENVIQTTYANGVSVVVNYNDSAVKVKGVEIEGYGYGEVNE